MTVELIIEIQPQDKHKLEKMCVLIKEGWIIYKIEIISNIQLSYTLIREI